MQHSHCTLSTSYVHWWCYMVHLFQLLFLGSRILLHQPSSINNSTWCCHGFVLQHARDNLVGTTAATFHHLHSVVRSSKVDTDDIHHNLIPPSDDQRKKPMRNRDHFFRTITKHICKVATSRRPKSSSQVVQQDQLDQQQKDISEITTQEELQQHWDDVQGIFRRKRNGTIDYTALLRAAVVKGNTQRIGSKEYSNYTHPVVQLLHERRCYLEKATTNTTTTTATTNNNATMTLPKDGAKVALAIEGGGMRGCVSAGMICAIDYLNLTNTIDVVYGSSAGTIVGAYLITNQLPWFGPELYYDRLTTAGRQFIDPRRLLRAIGMGLLDPRLLKDVVTRRACAGKPVLNLNYLLKRTVQETKPLNWDTFAARQKIQPLNIVASGLTMEESVVLNMANGAFETLEELTDAMHASCLLPGIAGPLINIDKRILEGQRVPPGCPKMILQNNINREQYEPLADALLYEPIPYRTAIAQDNVTHCIVIRSRPDGTDVTGKGGILERLIAKRFFLRKNRLPHIYQRLNQHWHKFLYAQDIIRLNQEAHSERDYMDLSKPHLLTIATPPGTPEVTRLEVRREAIFEGIRHGFARAYDCLVLDPKERGNGASMAKLYFPDEILDYEPLGIDVTDQSAFEAYMEQHNIEPKSWKASTFVHNKN